MPTLARKAVPAATQCLLCDVDGSLVHYSEVLEKEGTLTPEADAGGRLEYRAKDGGRTTVLLPLPPSATGLRGMISEKTLELMAAIRGEGTSTAIVSGARWTTVEKRLPFLPETEAVVSDNGGRIFWRRGDEGRLEEDEDWRAHIASSGACGPMEENDLAPEERSGTLWDLYRELMAKGWVCDARGYACSFRIRFPQTNPALNLEALQPILAALGEQGLTSFVNLGCVDILPAASGKLNAGLYLIGRLGARPESSTFLCDDDNDLELAAAVSEAVLPQCTAASVRDVVAQSEGGYFVASVAGAFGTEECLERVLARATRTSP